MSSLTEHQHAELLKYELSRHLRDTLSQFGDAVEAQANDCREELALALVETGQHMTSSLPTLRRRLRAHAVRAGEPGANGSLGAAPSRAAEPSPDRVPGSHLEVRQTLQGLGFLRPANEEAPEPAVPVQGRDPEAA